MRFDRRQFLQGLSASLLMPALAPRSAHAAAPPPKYYAHFTTNHGGVWARNMFPQAVAPQTQVYGGRTIRRQPLSLNVADGIASLSPVLSASSSRLTARLASKMNVIAGLDVPFYLAHHTGGHLGNFARNDGNGGDGTLAQQHPRRTIDQIMGWSSAFYPDLSGVRQRVLVMGDRVSYTYADPATKSGDIQAVAGDSDSNVWFDRLFPPGTSVGGPPPRAPVIGRVLTAYQQLRNSSRRLSADDRARIDQHVQRLEELQRRLTVAAPTCTQPTRPAQSNVQKYIVPNGGSFGVKPDAQVGFHQMLNDVITAGFSCGLSRIAVVQSGQTFSTYAGDWHQDIAHKANAMDGVAEGSLAPAHQRFFADVFLDLASKLDAVSDGQGGTLLDHALLVWTQECGSVTHGSFSMPIITFGGAGGAFRTGQYVDYRNLTKALYPEDYEPSYAGLFWHQWMGMVLRSMGVPSSEWAESDHGGYGWRYANLNWAALTTAQAYPDSLWTLCGEDLPWLGA
jgi:hypothetical protein